MNGTGEDQKNDSSEDPKMKRFMEVTALIFILIVMTFLYIKILFF